MSKAWLSCSSRNDGRGHAVSYYENTVLLADDYVLRLEWYRTTMVAVTRRRGERDRTVEIECV